MIARLRCSLLVAAGILLIVGRGSAQEDAPFSVRAAGVAGAWRPIVRVDRLLDDGALRKTLDSGLPLRVHLRVELWEKQLLDRLVGAQEISLALVRDPLDGWYVLETRGGERRFDSLPPVSAAIAAALRPELRPTGRGRFYYLATLGVESLSLSDLEELRRWLDGELRPAIQGRTDPDRVVRTGMRRLLVRVLGLPTRSFEARSQTFTNR